MGATTTLETARVDTPLGLLVVVAREERLVAASFRDRADELVRQLEQRFGPLAFDERPDPGGIVGRLKDYFAGDLAVLDTIPADPGGTPFQARVWTELRAIPVGSTVSYSELARRVDAQGAVRAVGAANGRNPVPIVIPCHRVIGADGSLTGYGGGLDRKRWLLAHEGVKTPAVQGRLSFETTP
jgi:methylated-DNA-[protein]-cysteine S-methyltransferase